MWVEADRIFVLDFNGSWARIERRQKEAASRVESTVLASIKAETICGTYRGSGHLKNFDVASKQASYRRSVTSTSGKVVRARCLIGGGRDGQHRS